MSAIVDYLTHTKSKYEKEGYPIVIYIVMCWLDTGQYLNTRLLSQKRVYKTWSLTKLEFIRYSLISINHTINFRRLKNGSSSPFL